MSADDNEVDAAAAAEEEKQLQPSIHLGETLVAQNFRALAQKKYFEIIFEDGSRVNNPRIFAILPPVIFLLCFCREKILVVVGVS